MTDRTPMHDELIARLERSTLGTLWWRLFGSISIAVSFLKDGEKALILVCLGLACFAFADILAALKAATEKE